MGSLFGKKKKPPKGPQGAAKALEGLEDELESPLTARDVRTGVKKKRRNRALPQNER